jgi:hypothetical protein
MPVYGGVGYCPCGQEIWLEYIRQDQGQGWAPRFSDAEGRELSRCPGCGRELREDDLASR